MFFFFEEQFLKIFLFLLAFLFKGSRTDSRKSFLTQKWLAVERSMIKLSFDILTFGLQYNLSVEGPDFG